MEMAGGKKKGSLTFIPHQKLSVEKCEVDRKKNLCERGYFIHPVPSFSFLLSSMVKNFEN